VVKVETPHFNYQFNSDSERELALFQVPEPRVQYCLQPVKLRPPSLPHVVEANVQVSTKIVEPGIVDQNPDQYRQCGNTHPERRLN
jgi:hypothetical protein